VGGCCKRARIGNAPAAIFPKSRDVGEALLLLLLKHGGEHFALWAKDTYEPLADYFRLDKRERSLSRNAILGDGHKEPYWHTWVQSAHKQLKKTGHIIQPNYRLWQLTEQGRSEALRIASEPHCHSFETTVNITPVRSAWLQPHDTWTLDDLINICFHP
jgi:hypothetical protein